MFGRRKVAALSAEFLATGVLTLVVLSVQRSTIGVPYFVAIAAGLVMAMLVYVFSAHANPAVTIALWTARKVGTLTAVLFVAMQLLGAWAAYALYGYFVNSSLQAVGGTYTGRVLIAEAIGALVLGLGWAVVVYRSNQTAGARASIVGVGYTVGVIVAAAVGIGIINPAVALGIHAWEVFGSMGWGTYVLGPVLGAVIGVNLYGLLFAGTNEDDKVAEAVVVEEIVVAETVVKDPVTNKKTTTKATTTTKKKTTAKKAPAKKKTTAKK